MEMTTHRTLTKLATLLLLLAPGMSWAQSDINSTPAVEQQIPRHATTCANGDANGRCADGSYGQAANNTASTSWPDGQASIWDGCRSGTLNCKIDTQGMWACDKEKTLCTLVNPRPAHVSDVGFQGLLRPNIKVFAHYMPWFCNSSRDANGRCNNHVYLNINSNTDTQARAVLGDLRRRGYDGLAIDWYGQPYGGTVYADCVGRYCKEDGATRKIRNNIGSFPQLKMVIVYDNSSYSTCQTNPTTTSCGGDCDRITADSPDGSSKCTKSDKIAADLLYLYDTYIASNDRYFTNDDGRPQIWFFGSNASTANFYYPQIRAYLAAQRSGFNPEFIFDFREQRDSYVSDNSDGTWAWSGRPATSCYGYTTTFNATAETTACTAGEGNNVEVCENYGSDHNFCQAIKSQAAPAKFDASGAFSKFDNRMAPWSRANGTSGSAVKIVPNRCGQTWLKSFEPVNSLQWGNNHPSAISINTWNDYDEGSEVETGIENCWKVDAPTVAQGTLYWSIEAFDPDGDTGPATANDATTATIDHFNVYISGDGVTPSDPSGERLAKVGEVPIAENQYGYRLNLPSLPAGKYIFYVQAVGKNSILDKLSPAATYRTE